MNQPIPAYPLKWPAGTPRTRVANRRYSTFGKYDWSTAIGNLRRELDALGARLVTISTNQPIRNDGQPYAQERRIDDPGVAIYFTLADMPVCFPCDRWLTIAENFRAITKHIEAMRGMDRWGVGKSNQAFAGYKALAASSEPDWWDVLGLDRSLSARDDIQAAYRARVAAAHPDHNNGDTTAMSRLNVARDAALGEVRS
jgi:hypothetical protein